jgi:hypothetical protein
MGWYYVDGGQQAGPVDDAQLAALASSGKILSDTLVWREGMDNWRMYGEVKAPGAAALKLCGGLGPGSVHHAHYDDAGSVGHPAPA